jgi:hypothetical protein
MSLAPALALRSNARREWAAGPLHATASILIGTAPSEFQPAGWRSGITSAAEPHIAVATIDENLPAVHPLIICSYCESRQETNATRH